MGDLERIGESPEFGEVLVRLLEAAGWSVTRRSMFAGGVVLTAVGFGTSVAAAGEVYAEAAFMLFERVMALKLWRQRAAA